MQNEEIFKKHGLISQNEQFETMYLTEDEIEKFMQKYLNENPGTEIETRYLNQGPVELTQNIQVRWLRPETPEIPPIIIKEVDVVEPEAPPLRIVETRQDKLEENPEPMVIREKPPFILIPEPKIAYVQNIKKQDSKQQQQQSFDKPIKIEHVRSNTQNMTNINNTNMKANRYEFDEYLTKSEREKQQNFSFQEQTSIYNYQDEYENNLPEYKLKNKDYEDEEQLRLYEEKLKQTLYEEYLLRLERERLEKKLSRSGLLEERIRERSISQERMSQLSNRFSNVRMRDDESLRLRQVRDNQMKHHIIKERRAESLDYHTQTKQETSSFNENKFSKVTNQNELNRFNEILDNQNSLGLQTKSEADNIASSLYKFDNAKSSDYFYDKYNIRQTNKMVDTGVYNINELTSDRRYRKDYLESNSPAFSKNNYDNSSSGDLPRTESQKKYFEDLKAYELFNQGLRNSFGKVSNLDSQITKSGSSNGVSHRITTIKKYYNNNKPHENYTETNVYVKNS